MNHEDFYKKCTSDAAYFFDIYFRLMRRITSLEFIDNNQQLETKDGTKVDFDYQEIFYFLFLFLHVTSDIGKKLKANSVDIFNYFNYSTNILLEIDICTQEVNKNTSKDITKREGFYFYKSIIQSGIDWTREKITLERVLYNILSCKANRYNIRKAFNLTNYFMNNILEEAEQKESGTLKTVIMNDPTSFEAILENLKAGKLKTEDVNKIVEEPASVDEQETDEQIKFSYGEELTTKPFKYNPLIGREKELRLLGTLLLDEEKSVIIHGKPGVGKTALIEGLSYKIANGNIHPLLLNKRIFEVSATEIISGTHLRGQLEAKITKMMKELMQIENSILFVDEIHMLMGAGASIEDTNDVSNMLKPYLGSGKIKIIGATTDIEYLKIFKNGAFARRFNGLELKELSEEELFRILYSLIERYNQIKFNYNNDVRDEILHLIICLSDEKYMTLTPRYNPDFALSVLRNAYNFARYDQKDYLDASSLIEGVEILDTVNVDGKEMFKEEIQRLTRKR